MRNVILSDEFSTYYDSLSVKIQDKYAYVLQILKTQKVVSEKFVKKIKDNEFYKILIPIGTNEYRTLSIAIDGHSFMESERVILLNSFLKKDSKQYKRKIEKARTLIEKEELI